MTSPASPAYVMFCSSCRRKLLEPLNHDDHELVFLQFLLQFLLFFFFDLVDLHNNFHVVNVVVIVCNHIDCLDSNHYFNMEPHHYSTDWTPTTTATATGGGGGSLSSNPTSGSSNPTSGTGGSANPSSTAGSSSGNDGKSPSGDPGGGSSSSSSSLSTGAIAGIAAGLGLLCLVVAAVFVLVLVPRWKQQRRADKTELLSSIYVASGSGGSTGRPARPGTPGSPPPPPSAQQQQQNPNSAHRISDPTMVGWQAPVQYTAAAHPDGQPMISAQPAAQHQSNPDLMTWTPMYSPAVMYPQDQAQQPLVYMVSSGNQDPNASWTSQPVSGQLPSQNYYPAAPLPQSPAEQLQQPSEFLVSHNPADPNASEVVEMAVLPPQPTPPNRTTSKDVRTSWYPADEESSGLFAALQRSPLPHPSTASNPSLSRPQGPTDVAAIMAVVSASDKEPLPNAPESVDCPPSHTVDSFRPTSASPDLSVASTQFSNRSSLFSGVPDITAALVAAAATAETIRKRNPAKPRNLHSWTPREVAAALADEGVEAGLLALFLRNEIDGVVLETIDSAFLANEMGIAAAGVRARVMMAVGKVRGDSVRRPPEGVARPAEGVVDSGTLSPPPYLS
ncbi:hypothetical protein DFJ73DRAFT_756074 [Zopfochytrium polystomum]|nr:hypothetical protein DFJ73DRAFT_756074 [Zopfochytrium polystomum]